MSRGKLCLLVSSLLLLQIVTIEAKRINLIKVNQCLKVSLDLVSAVSRQIMPVIKDMINCVKYEVKINTERMNLMQLVLVVYQFFLYALNNRLDCLANAYMSMSAVTIPKTDELSSLKCMYLFVEEPLC
ncbi:uncharacterized protein [Drosophila kikkawai]|uniref:Accessory gland protein Acp53Ea n=1 Tax=Drosophila kikkawai TaxID=30033 RepID=A0A6P4I6E5_DROKI|nr:uncharacterized protein LOC108076258 [Drosophila kikkawai]